MWGSPELILYSRVWDDSCQYGKSGRCFAVHHVFGSIKNWSAWTFLHALYIWVHKHRVTFDYDMQATHGPSSSTECTRTKYEESFSWFRDNQENSHPSSSHSSHMLPDGYWLGPCGPSDNRIECYVKPQTIDCLNHLRSQRVALWSWYIQSKCHWHRRSLADVSCSTGGVAPSCRVALAEGCFRNNSAACVSYAEKMLLSLRLTTTSLVHPSILSMNANIL